MPAMMLAWLDALVNHCIQPTSNAANRPNAARVYKYGPPVPSKRLPTSAKHNATDIDARPIRTNPIGLQPPICAATCAGIRKMAPPITWLTPIAVRSHRPSARRSVGFAGAVVETAMRAGCIMNSNAHDAAAALLHRSRVLQGRARSLLFQPLDLRRPGRS